ncbi:hypothetical protein HPB51_023335 [Rhipicephalus microplus]|uniref:Tick transposon n=1 Tax=Rhipicephalus microplus TaxID=6941 RepID=A0A9J6EIR0_RHIMP|nr:hypothetical protein HPB51_023335 [Rhipicephalus microplus]
MHKSLKYSYFAGKVNQRLDRLLLVLFSFKADKLFSRAIALVKGKGDHRKTALFKKCKAGLEILPLNIVKVRHGQWKVESQSKTGSHYAVERTEVICTGSISPLTEEKIKESFIFKCCAKIPALWTRRAGNRGSLLVRLQKTYPRAASAAPSTCVTRIQCCNPPAKRNSLEFGHSGSPRFIGFCVLKATNKIF